MKQEEILDKLRKMLYHTQKANECGLSNNDFKEDIEVLEGILDLYNKEKEKNKTLEKLLQGRLFELYKYYKDLASEYQANCISKNKIKPIQIIDLDGKIHNVYKIEEE